MCQCLCVVWDYDDERKGEGETRCRLIACSSRKAPRGPPGLTSPSDGRIAINSIISESSTPWVVVHNETKGLCPMGNFIIIFTCGIV